MSHVPIFYWRPLPPPKMASTIASAGPRRANTASSCAQTTVLGAATFQSSVAAAGFAMVIGLVTDSMASYLHMDGLGSSDWNPA